MIDIKKLQTKFVEEIMEERCFYPKYRTENIARFEYCDIVDDSIYMYGKYQRRLNDGCEVPFRIEVSFFTGSSSYSLEISIRCHSGIDAEEANLRLTSDNDLEYIDSHDRPDYIYNDLKGDESYLLNKTMIYVINCFRSKLLYIIEDDAEDDMYSE